MRDGKWKNWLLMAVVIVLCLAAMEGMLRILKPYALTTRFLLPPNISVAFNTVEFKTRITTNGAGMRGNDFDTTPVDGAERIVALGDSFTFGWGVSDDASYPARLQAGLHQAGHRNLEVINAGRPGDGLPDYIRTLHHHVLRLKPKAVILGFLPSSDCPVGDPRQSVPEDRIAARTAEIIARSQKPWKKVSFYLSRMVTTRVTKPARRWVKDRLAGDKASNGDGATIARDPISGHGNPLDPDRLMPEVEAAGEAVRQRYARLKATGWIGMGQRWKISPWLIRTAIFNPDHARHALFQVPDSVSAMNSQWRVCEGLIRHMAETVTDAGAAFVLLTLTPGYQADPKFLQFRNQIGIPVPATALADDTTDAKIGALCQRDGLNCVRTLAPVRAAIAAGGKLYHTMDGHMTAAGNALIANLVAKHMALRLPVPGHQ